MPCTTYSSTHICFAIPQLHLLLPCWRLWVAVHAAVHVLVQHGVTGGAARAPQQGVANWQQHQWPWQQLAISGRGNNFISGRGNNFISGRGNNFISGRGNNFISGRGNNFRMLNLTLVAAAACA
jgi:hypothetical protein